MMSTSSILRGLSLCLALSFLTVSTVQGAFPFLKTTKRVEADAQKEYYLQDSDGLWFIMAKTFTGDDARSRTNELVYELRKKYKLNAFIYKLDPNKADADAAGHKEGNTHYRYQTPRVLEYAVLVGSFPSNEDLALRETLLSIKRSKPECLSKDPAGIALTAKFAELAKTNKEFTGFGPLAGAIVVPNPLISKEFYSQKGVVDPFIEKINSDSPYNLLNNPKMYTLRVATFSGDMKYQKMNEGDKQLKSKLELAGIRAHALCTALRKKGVDAWEFHDRDSSFVTIGSFDDYGRIRADGRTEINPEINKLIEKYRGQITQASGAYRAYTVVTDVSDGTAKKKRMEIPFDLQPLIILVPQRPENMKRTMLARKRLDEERRIQNQQRAEETAMIESEEQNRHYALKKQALQQERENARTGGVALNTAQPGMVQPGMVQPGMVQPGMVQAGMVQPGMVQAGMVQAGMVQAGMVQPGMVQPGMVQPGMAQPGMVQAGMVQPGMVQPGVAVNPQLPQYTQLTQQTQLPQYTQQPQQAQLPQYTQAQQQPAQLPGFPANASTAGQRATPSAAPAFGTNANAGYQPVTPGIQTARENTAPTY